MPTVLFILNYCSKLSLVFELTKLMQFTNQGLHKSIHAVESRLRNVKLPVESYAHSQMLDSFYPRGMNRWQKRFGKN